jgi:hypothetical protein
MGTSLGGGSLQDYLINSNTSSDGFLYCLEDMKGKKKAKSPEKDKKMIESMAAKPKKRSSTVEPKPVPSGKDEKGGGDEDKVMEELTQEQLAAIVSNLTEPMRPFRKLQSADCQIFSIMKDYGQKVAPLNVIGNFLNYAGNHMLHYIVKEILEKEKAKKSEVLDSH